MDEFATWVAIGFACLTIGLVTWKYFRSDPSTINPWHNVIVGVLGIALITLVIFPKIKLSVSPEGLVAAELEKVAKRLEQAENTAEEAKEASQKATSSLEGLESELVTLAGEVSDAKLEVQRIVEIPAQVASFTQTRLSKFQDRLDNLMKSTIDIKSRLVDLEQQSPAIERQRRPIASIFFESGSAEISPIAVQSLDDSYKTLMTETYDQITVVGYTDSLGSEFGNQQLSLQRIWAVAKYLIGRGLPPIKVVTLAYGESKLPILTPGETLEQLNRRVDIFVEQAR